MEPLALIGELKDRLSWTLDADEERDATGALEDASDLARAHGLQSWVDASSSPRLVRTLVLKSVKRYMNNPEGYIQSRAGDETLMWNDDSGENAGTVYFTSDEIKLLERLAGIRQGLVSVSVIAWGTKDEPVTGYAPVDGPGGPEQPFPFFADSVSPW